MSKTKKIIICTIMLAIVVVTMVAPTFAASYVSIKFCGEFTYGTLYNVDDVVMYQGDLYRCLISNAIAEPTQSEFWAKFFSGGDYKYNQGYTDGYIEGYDKGDSDGYNQGLEEGYADGYDVGYTDGYADGALANSDITIENDIGGYLNGEISLYVGSSVNFPSVDSLVATYPISDTNMPNQKAIFSLLDINIIIRNNSKYNENPPNNYTLLIIPGTPIDWGTYPFILRSTDSNINLSNYLTVSFIGEDFVANSIVGQSGDLTYYIPNSTINYEYIDYVQIHINNMQGLTRALSIDGNATNQVFISYNRTTQPFISSEMLTKMYESGYNSGYTNGERNGYNIGFGDGKREGYDIGYNEGYLASQGGEGFSGLFDGIAKVPITTLTSLLGFEIFGVNVLGTLLGILTIVVVAFLIKRFI